MGWSSNLSIYGSDSLFTLCKELFPWEWWAKWHELVVLAVILLVAALLVVLFSAPGWPVYPGHRGQRGHGPASSINPSFTITVGLCLSNSLTGLAGCLIGLLNKSCDINLGTGMVTVALASLIIGESLMAGAPFPAGCSESFWGLSVPHHHRRRYQYQHRAYRGLQAGVCPDCGCGHRRPTGKKADRAAASEAGRQKERGRSQMLKLDHISKTFNPGTLNEKKALDQVDLHLERGDFVTIVGSNGAGSPPCLTPSPAAFSWIAAASSWTARYHFYGRAQAIQAYWTAVPGPHAGDCRPT